ncbi:MAG: hypothetical protein WC462_04930 [archaeon]
MGIYSTLEGKWYDFLEWLNNYVPVLKLTDKIDGVVPSFALFLSLLVLIMVLILALNFLKFSSIYEAELTILTGSGNPVEGAIIQLTQQCDGGEKKSTLTTNGEGKATFTSCSEIVDVSVSKEEYLPLNKTLELSGEKEHSLTLSPRLTTAQIVTIKVINEKKEILPKATLELICILGKDSNKQQVKTNEKDNAQPSTGFEIVTPQKCSSVQLKASAQGYNDKTITLTGKETRISIQLEKVLNQGTIIFTADSPIGLQNDAIIIVTNLVTEQEETLFTLASGQVREDFAEGEYSYTAMAKSFIESGEFTVTANNTKDVNIYFKSLTKDANSKLDSNSTKNIYLQLMDNNTPVIIAEAKIFFTKNGDTNSAGFSLTAKTRGIIGPQPMLDITGKTFTAIVKASGYETKIVPIELRTKAEGPQVVQMNQGGAKLTVKVIDDINRAIEGVQTVLYNSQFPAPFEKGLFTDKNGEVYYKNLPSGTYRVTAKTDTDEGEINNISMSSSDKEVTLLMVTGRGTMRFNFSGEAGKINPAYGLYQKNSSGEFESVESGTALNGRYTTKKLKSGTEIKLVVIDGNYFGYESPVYKINRTSQEKSVFLRKQSELPNQNEVQMILRNVYSSNPITLRETEATKLMPGNKYYLLFDLVLNNETQGNTITNFFVGPENKDMLDSNTNISIEGAYSIDNSAVKMTKKMKGFLIDEVDSFSADSEAKQANVLLNNQTGLKIIPIIVEVNTDENAGGQVKITFQAKNGNYTSLKYSKEFEIGKTFCMGADCPALLFSNYLTSNGTRKPIDDSVQSLQMESTYTLITTLENLTDELIGDANITLSIEKSGQDKFLFSGDKNTATQQVKINPLSTTQEKSFSVVPKKAAYGASKIYEKAEKKEGTTDLLKDYKGNNEYVRFEVKSKNDLNMVIVATDTINTIYEKSEYPVFLIKVISTDPLTRTKKNSKANWSATINGQSFNCRPSGSCSGQTDANGLQTISFDASNIVAGTIIHFVAVDENNSTPATLDINVSKPFPTEQTLVPECLMVKVAGTNIKNIEFPTILLNVGSKGSFTIESTCEEDRLVAINSDIGTVPKQFTLKAGESQAIQVDGTSTVQARNGMLGAYPLQVIGIKAGAYSQVGFIDIIMNDENSPFVLDKFIFDFRRVDKISAKVTNKTFAGRKDNYYPKMDISTNSVALNYSKPGIPEIVNFSTKITGMAMESYIVGFGKSDRGYMLTEEDMVTAEPKTPKEFNFTDDLTAMCEEFKTPPEVTQRPEPDMPETDLNAFYSLPQAIKNKIVSQIIPVEGKITDVNSDANLSNIQPQKEKKLSFFGWGPFTTDNLFGAISDCTPLNGTSASGCVGGGVDRLLGGDSDSEDDTGSSDGNVGECEDATAILEKVSTIKEENEFTDNGAPEEGEDGEELVGPIYNTRLYTDQLGSIDPSGMCEFPDCGETGLLRYVGDGIYLYYNFITYDLNGARTWPDEKIDSPGFAEALLNRSSSTFATRNSKLQTKFKVLEACTDGESHDAVYFSSHVSMVNYGLFDVQGKNTPCGFLGLSQCWENGCLDLQVDLSSAEDQIIRRAKIWTKDFNIVPIEGKVYDLGKYDANPVPEWTNHEMAMEDTEEIGASLYTKGCGYPRGFVSPDYVAEVDAPMAQMMETAPFEVPDPNSPFIEYDSTGLIWYELYPADIPQGFRMFIKKGHVYAEYIGNMKWVCNVWAQCWIEQLPPDVDGPDINFTLTKVNLMGTEYAIITVQDWVSGTEKQQKIFQVKLVGNPTNCYTNEGVAGFTGKEFVPKLLFNWDWNAISYDQCDSLNDNYTYCDATQFTTSLFKRINKIQDLKLVGNKDQEIPQLTGFYAYLIKDNYSQGFLQDYDDYYSSSPFTSTMFNTVGTIKGYDQFITNKSNGENRIKFKIRTGETTQDKGELPYGGLYRVEIGIDYDNENIQSLFDNNAPNASITITFTPVTSAKNYNAFYETPFDGEVGKKGEEFIRDNYGVSIGATEGMKLNSANTKAYQYSNPFINVNYRTSSSLSDLDSQIVLNYNNGSKTLRFNPSQPTPVMMTITSDGGPVNTGYKIGGFDSETSISKKWKLVSSTIGKKECLDFSGNKERVFNDVAVAGGNRLLSWSDGVKKGTISMLTTFFTPKVVNVSDVTTLTPAEEKTKLATTPSVPSLTSGSTIILKYLDDSGVTDYDTLQGMFDRVANGQMCMSQNSENTLQIWWNPDYINSLAEDMNSSNGNAC